MGSIRQGGPCSFLALVVLILFSLHHPGAARSPLSSLATTTIRPIPSSSSLPSLHHPNRGSLLALVKRRGGAKLATKETKSKKDDAPMRPRKKNTAMSRVKEVYMNIPLATRVHLTMVLVVTVLSLGIIDPVYLILDLNRTFRNLELWRPFTAAAFLGTPSMSWASSTYFMVQYGQALEASEGTAQQVIFLLFQVFALSLLAGLIGLPVTSNSLITAALHCCGRADPKREVNWMLSLRVKYWVLPFCLAAVDVLQSQNPMAAIPHAVGILTGHLYYFLRHIWPKLGGSDLLQAPERLMFLDRSKNDEIIFGKDGDSDSSKASTAKSKKKVYKMK